MSVISWKRKYGYIPQTYESSLRMNVSGRIFRCLSTQPQDLPESYLMHVFPPFDQGSTASCVAQALARACALAASLDLSRRAIYALARHRGSIKSDLGCYLSDAISIIAEYGVCDEQTCPWDEWEAQLPKLSISERFACRDHADCITHRLVPSDMDAIKSEIYEGRPIVCGVMVTKSFESCHSMDPIELSGPQLGGHAIVLLGWTEHGVILQNSWGPDWGANGIGQLSPDSVASIMEAYSIGGANA